ncbi:uncharacterized protein J3R85_002435 [Psidium guajava]|nr:uncharacterized protein J3R85_002435 [Psidium guajava]
MVVVASELRRDPELHIHQHAIMMAPDNTDYTDGR